MNVEKLVRMLQWCLPLALTAVWSGAPLVAQEKPSTLLLRRTAEVGVQFSDTGDFPPTPLAPPMALKSEKTALQLSLWGTLIPVSVGTALLVGMGNEESGPESGASAFPPLILLTTGYLFGPSLGYFYGGRPGRAWTGVGIRVVGTGAIIAAIAASWDNPDAGGAEAAALFGLGLIAISPHLRHRHR